ncbi:Peptidoglycan-binding (PGRP) domain of peptidoglycan hydrolases-containing protein [Pseudoxanthomonas sp. GM95]|uniref:transglycosylase SLT domain-containing protein n=1 Tax=Pseudoxanthomonas sp. GM95 TaxID=1881043 RepID=UPI0008C26030|nr:XVIPCD domain-containing protein [Pseudoxanthomonas sp. GM95]SEM10672.1 Peptidoglycan-binding (PGRP) domain of peptidoglycan hydrolases-containing protein [Pseudoxanthomonas sp. GM95]
MARIDERWSEHRQELEAAAKEAGVDVGVMVKIAAFESGFNPTARPIAVTDPENNTVTQFDGTMAVSSAYGYGQFLNGTWQEMINKYGEKYGVQGAADMTRDQANAAGLRQDTRLQAAMLAEFTRENVDRAAQYGGSDVAANVYAMHNLGTGDGPNFLQALRDNPNARADSVLSAKVIAGNPSLYGDGSRSIADSYAAMGQKMDQYSHYAQEAEQGLPSNSVKPSQGTSAPAPARDAMADGVLKQGEGGAAVQAMQEKLAGLGATGADGKPLVPDADFGKNTRHAVEEFQRQQGLEVDGKAGPKTLEALEAAFKARGQETAAPERAAAQSPSVAKVPTLADAEHPDHARYGQVMEKLQGLEAQRAQAGLQPMFKNPQELANAAGQVTFESKVSGMPQVDAIVARPDGAGVFAVHGQLGDPAAQRVYVDRAQATGQSVEASSQQLGDFNRQFAQEQAQPAQTQAQGMGR